VVRGANLVTRGFRCQHVCSSDSQGSRSVRTFPLEILPVEYLLVRLNRMLSMWPTHLRLEIIATGLHPLDVQAWLLEHRAPVARIQCAPDTDSHDFGELITSLKERKSVRRSDIHRDCLSRIGRSRL